MQFAVSVYLYAFIFNSIGGVFLMLMNKFLTKLRAKFNDPFLVKLLIVPKLNNLFSIASKIGASEHFVS